jgi:hypothetical protein
VGGVRLRGSRLRWPGTAAGYATYEEFVGNSADPDEITLDETTFNILRSCDLKAIIAGSEMSENHLGGDDLVSVADDLLAAIKEGYAITTWYGAASEALVAGYRPGQLSVIFGGEMDSRSA